MVPDHLYVCAEFISHNGTVYPLNLSYTLSTCQRLYQFRLTMALVCSVIGIPGSTAIYLTMTSMENTPTSFYMICLSIANAMAILVYAAIIPSNNADLEVLRKVSGTLSYYTLTLINVERLVAIRYPYIKRRWFTMENTKLSVCFSFFLVVAEYITLKVLRLTVNLSADIEDLLIMVTMVGVPVIICTLCCVGSLRGLKVLAFQQTKRFSGSSLSWSAVDPGVVYLIVGSSIIFIALCAPFIYVSVTWFASPRKYRRSLEFRREIHILRVVSRWLVLLHLSLVFYIYVLGTRRFRNQFYTVVSASFLTQWRRR